MKDLTTGNEFKHIIKFSLPMLLGSAFQQLYNVVDSWIVGNLLPETESTLAQGAVGASFSLIFLLVALIMGITMGISVLISQFYGIKDFKRVKLSVDSMMIFVIIYGIFIGLIGVVFAKSIFSLLNVPTKVIPGATRYFQIISAGMIFTFGYNGVSAVLRGLGDSKTPLYFLILSTILNIFLDLFFILQLKMGIAGVAIATVIAQAISFFALVIYLNKRHSFIKIDFLNLKFDKEIFLKSIKIGLPSGIQSMIVGLSGTMLMAIVGSFGAATIAGFSVAIRIDAFAVMPAMNISIAVTNFVGQNIANGFVDRVKRGYNSAVLFSLMFSFVTGIIFVFFSKYLVAFFTKDPEVLSFGSDYLRITGPFYILISAMFCTNGVLRGAGDTMVPMYNTLFAMCLVRLPVAYLLSRTSLVFFGKTINLNLGSNGIWWGQPTAWLCGFLLAYTYYRRGNWKTKYKEIIAIPID